MRVVIFGAGGVGLGFMGDLLQRSCAGQVFVDVNSALVESLNGRGGYLINQADLHRVTQLSVTGVSALDSSLLESRGRLAEELAAADFAITSVGARVLPLVGRMMAEIARDFPLRERPLDILCCENHADAAGLLRASMAEVLGAGEAEARFGFVNTVVGRMCQVLTRSDRDLPPVTPDLDQVLLVEDYDPFPIDAGALRGPVPAMACLEAVPTEQFQAYEHRKLYAHNGVHALLAVLGKLRGYRYFYEAGQDPELDAIGRRGMWEEMGAALVRAHPRYFTTETIGAFAEDLYSRLLNPIFGDEIARGTRDTLRMIRPEDGRLIGAAIFVAEQGLVPRAMCLGVAGALRDNGLGIEVLDEALAKTLPECAAEVRKLVSRALEVVEDFDQPGRLDRFIAS